MQPLLRRETRKPLHPCDGPHCSSFPCGQPEPTHVSCTEDAMVAQSQVREGLFEITLRYRSFVSNHAPHICEMRRSSRTAANAATHRKCCHPPVTCANIRACSR